MQCKRTKLPCWDSMISMRLLAIIIWSLALLTLSSSFTIKRRAKEKSHAIDGDGLIRREIPFINKGLKTPVVQGDIASPPGRNALIDKAYRWKFPIPYILTNNLDLNAKGVIHQAFETYRLKSCVDFKPHEEGEKSFIKFEKLDGCWSMVGDLKEGQQLSLGPGCDYKGTIMHELLHALGFYHEQSRSDRDDYINIHLDQVIPGLEHSFDKYDDTFITDQNTAYDYESIMHYGPYAFNIDPNYPTMTAKDPEKTKLMGQYNDFSDLDLLRLNRMYNCSAPLTLLDQCAFETSNECGMIQSAKDDANWIHTRSTPSSHDHTLLGQCDNAGFFMHYPTSLGLPDDSAFLESRLLYPKRKLQCLQFFYKMTGSPKDKLVIWARREDPKGKTLSTTAAATFMGDDDHSWKIAHVPFKMDGKFRYAFQGLRGDPSSSQGGIVIDDVTLAETRCPSGVWRIANFSRLVATMAPGEYLQSPRFHSPEGYGFGLQFAPNSEVYSGWVGAFFHLTSWVNDHVLEWPVGNRQVTVTVLDQDPDVTRRQSFSLSFTTNGKQLVSGTNQLFWDNPAKVGTYDASCDCYRGNTWGWNGFFSHAELQRRSYLKNDDLILFIEFEDLTSLVNLVEPRGDTAIRQPPQTRVGAGNYTVFPFSGQSTTKRSVFIPRRNAILDGTWKMPIPYILTDSLELNAKGVILQAFEMYRLKSCIDFKPYEGERTYLSFTKLDGCWSFVGDLGEGQNVSIGARCDTRAIVEHELLHALGFYHEQSRSDRDDYVRIHWDQIIEGKEHNFNKYEDDTITDLNTPYDYESIMHYRPLSFNKDPNIPTITTAIPAFNNVIGQRLDFSAVDLERLNRKYECAATHTLMDQCSFEQINICGMIQNDSDDADWVQTPSTTGSNDHTLGGQCRDAGLFMHFDTSNAKPGKSALLESRILYPKRSQQCLRFFYRMSGPAADKLVIWLRMDDGTGNIRKVKKVHTITGSDGDTSWKIAHVPLSVGEKFRYFFQGITGLENQPSSGISIDDITLTETVCPSAVWQIRNFSNILASTPFGSGIRSDRFYNSEGYAFGFTVYPNGLHADFRDYLGVRFHLCTGENDGVMEWPAKNRQVTITAMDQDPDATLQMSNSRSFTTDSDSIWNKPGAENGTLDEECGCYRGPEFGWSTFMSHLHLHRRSFLKNGDLIITADFDDLTHLLKTEVPVVVQATEDEDEEKEEETHPEEVPAIDARPRKPRALNKPCSPNPCLNGGVCVERQGQATCRCVSGKSTFYTGDMCQSRQVAGTVVGVVVGGVMGSMVLLIAILALVRQRV
ncbi:hypothetical protein ACEWY4_022222 [Coilia grayii]|uniref:Metalloendopeptidase n=1 Tax=Coilia grayii TaxID=363190 RepID=A0ABD1J6G0_9TELE